MRTMRTLSLVALALALASASMPGCATTELPDGTIIRTHDMDAIWEYARIGMAVAELRHEMKREEHEWTLERQERQREDIEGLLEYAAELRERFGLKRYEFEDPSVENDDGDDGGDN